MRSLIGCSHHPNGCEKGNRMIKPWRSVRSNTPQSFRIFSIRTETAVSPRTGTEHDFYIIESRDWVNIIPVTPDRFVVMIRQYRHGQGKVTLEIPGGLVDPGDTPQEAATRELLEETGTGQRVGRRSGRSIPILPSSITVVILTWPGTSERSGLLLSIRPKTLKRSSSLSRIFRG